MSEYREFLLYSLTSRALTPTLSRRERGLPSPSGGRAGDEGEKLLTKIFLNVAGLAMPYLTVALGLYVFRDAWVAILGYHAGIVLLVTLGRGWDAARKFIATAPIGRALIFGLGGFSAGAMAYLLWPLIGVSPQLPAALLDWGLNDVSWPWFIAYSALVNPWLEEIYWRGWLGSETRQPVLNDAAFAGFHLVILAPFISIFWLAFAFFVLSFAGWLWRQATRVERSMLASTLFHLAADVSILLVVRSAV